MSTIRHGARCAHDPSACPWCSAQREHAAQVQHRADELPVRVTAIDRAPGTTPDGRAPMRHEQRLEVLGAEAHAMSRRHVVVPRDTFVTTVRQVIDGGEYPSGVRINKLLGRGGRYLAPVECQWRREACAEAGFTLNGQNLNGRKGKRRPPIRINDAQASR